MVFNQKTQLIKQKAMDRRFLSLIFLFLTVNCYPVQPLSYGNGYYIGDNLDLEAVAYLFGQAKNPEEFEQMLNDPNIEVSNLDLNRDGYIDYLRIMETKEYGDYNIVIQAVLGRNLFQNVATIVVRQRYPGKTIVQVTGNEYLYGPDYIFEPLYTGVPLIIGYFGNPYYKVWHSPYYWGYYPRHYVHRRPAAVLSYHRHIKKRHYAPHAVRSSSYYRNKRNNHYHRRPGDATIHRNEHLREHQEIERKRSQRVIRQRNQPTNIRRSSEQSHRQETPRSSDSSHRRSGPSVIRKNTSVSPGQSKRKSNSSQPSRQSVSGQRRGNSVSGVNRTRSSSSEKSAAQSRQKRSAQSQGKKQNRPGRR